MDAGLDGIDEAFDQNGLPSAPSTQPHRIEFSSSQSAVVATTQASGIDFSRTA
jgi:hypothetical protein